MMRTLSSYKEFLFPFLLTKINPRGGRLPEISRAPAGELRVDPQDS